MKIEIKNFLKEALELSFYCSAMPIITSLLIFQQEGLQGVFAGRTNSILFLLSLWIPPFFIFFIYFAYTMGLNKKTFLRIIISEFFWFAYCCITVKFLGLYIALDKTLMFISLRNLVQPFWHLLFSLFTVFTITILGKLIFKKIETKTTTKPRWK